MNQAGEVSRWGSPEHTEDKKRQMGVSDRVCFRLIVRSFSESRFSSGRHAISASFGKSCFWQINHDELIDD
nr:hypothetical protein [Rubripirellula sp.]